MIAVVAVILYLSFNDRKSIDSGISSELSFQTKTKQHKDLEMYLGLNRLKYISKDQVPDVGSQKYVLPKSLDLNSFAMAGNWNFSLENARLDDSQGAIRLHFYAAKVYFTAAAQTPVKLIVKENGKVINTLTVSESKIYNLFDSTDPGEHTIDIEIQGSGLEAFIFTFG